MPSEKMPTFKAGDVVQLRSGGPLMTIAWVDDYRGKLSACCDWFVADKALGKKEQDVFPITSIKFAER
jgi:uncharacterized protein YodC (DUF2158 family)